MVALCIHTCHVTIFCIVLASLNLIFFALALWCEWAKYKKLKESEKTESEENKELELNDEKPETNDEEAELNDKKDESAD